MDPTKIDPTVSEAYSVPQQTSLDIDALVACLHKRVPGYLRYFSTDGKTKTPQKASQSEAMEEDILLLLENEVTIPSGPSAQSAVPTMGTKLPAPVLPSVQRETPTYKKMVHPETSPASSEVEEIFTSVTSKSQKRKLKASKSLANPPKKASVTIPQTPVRPQPTPTPACVASPAEESSDSPMVEPPKERVPPLYIREKNRWEKIIPLLDQLNIEFLNARSTAVGIRVQCPDSHNHRRLTATLRSENIGFHTYALPDERVIRAVIRGLPKEISPEMIKEDLLAQGLPVQQVHRMYHHRSKQPFDMVLVILDLNPEGKKIWELRSVCRLSGLRIQEPNGRGKMGQCHNCQLYGHSARNCFAQPRCVKCLGDHGTSDCPRKQPVEEDPPSCVLCRTKGHPANYRGCPKAPREPRRRVKPAGRSAPQPPKPQFVPAPVPSTNAWHRPLLRAGPAPIQASTVANDGHVPPAYPTVAAGGIATTLAPPSAVAPNSSVTPVTKTASFSSDWKYVSHIINSIDVEQLHVFVQKAKHNFEDALFEHADLIVAITACKKTLNG